MAKYDLLSVENDAKTVKGNASGYLTGVLYLAPTTEASEVNLCPMSSAECKRACLYGSGMAAVFPAIKRARIAKTLEYLHNPAVFEAKLISDIDRLAKEANKRGMKPAVRINGTSDLPKLARKIAAMFPDVQFYDYTKLPKAWSRVSGNYHLTFSHSGTNLDECFKALKHGVNVAVVFAGSELPATWHGFPVVNGDESDLRFLDAKGVIVGLKAKGEAKRMDATAGGFIQLSAA